MPPTKRMPLALQARLIRTDLIAAGYEPELSDIRAFMDGSLSYPENRALVAKAFGYRVGTRRGAVPKNLDDLTFQAGIWNRQQADRRRRAAPPSGKTQTRRKRKLKTSARWQSDPWPRPGDVIDEGRKAKLPGRRVAEKSGKVYYERRRNRSDMPWKKV
ncbi:MAG TPA: hypothetical protein PLP90_04915 [Methanoculleus sp.]|nr:hypothetical protein [Methanoculleus sp.]